MNLFTEMRAGFVFDYVCVLEIKLWLLLWFCFDCRITICTSLSASSFWDNVEISIVLGGFVRLRSAFLFLPRALTGFAFKMLGGFGVFY